jgi:hypothetical protein
MEAANGIERFFLNQTITLRIKSFDPRRCGFVSNDGL